MEEMYLDDIRIEVVRVPKRQTISMIIQDDGNVVIRCAQRVTKKQLNEFVQQKSGWLREHYDHIKARSAVAEDILKFKKVMVDGKPRPLVVGPHPGIYPDRVEIRSRKHFKAELANLYIDKLGKTLVDRCKDIAKLEHLTPASVTCRSYRSRWACCDRDGNISLCFVLIMLPPVLQTLVFAHELCHLVCMDHSGAFHDILEQMVPDHRKLQKCLNDQCYILRLYTTNMEEDLPAAP